MVVGQLVNEVAPPPTSTRCWQGGGGQDSGREERKIGSFLDRGRNLEKGPKNKIKSVCGLKGALRGGGALYGYPDLFGTRRQTVSVLALIPPWVARKRRKRSSTNKRMGAPLGK